MATLRLEKIELQIATVLIAEAIGERLKIGLPADDQEMRLVRKVHAAFEAAKEEAFPRPISTLEEHIRIEAAAKMCAGRDVARLLGLAKPASRGGSK